MATAIALIERMTLKSAHVGGDALYGLATDGLGAWGGMDHSTTPNHEGFSEVTFDRRGISVEAAAHALSAFGPDWQIVITYWSRDDI